MKKSVHLLCVVFGLSSGPVVAVELSGSAMPNTAVPGNCGWGCGTPLTSTIVIPAGVASINDIRCSVRIVGVPGFSSVVPELTSPSGHTVTLANFNCPGTSSQPTIDVTFGQGPNAYSASNLAAGWSFIMDSCPAPGPSMNSFDTLDATGTWTLSVYRDFMSSTATLVEWELIVSDGQIGTVPPPANDDCLASIVITDLSTTVFDMTSATASLVADCMAGTQADIWYRLENAPCAGNYTFSAATSSFNTVVSVYDGAGGCPVPGVVAIACGSGDATAALVLGQTVYVQVSAAAGATPGPGEIVVSSDTAPANDDCSGPEILAPMTASIAFDTTCATDGFTQTCSAGPASMFPLVDVWYLFTADCDGSLTLDTFGSSFDTAIAAWPSGACPTGPAPFCNDDAASPPPGQSNRSLLTISPVSMGEQFLIQIGGGVLGAKGSGVLNVTWNCTAPVDVFLRGNCNNDGSINIADAVFTLSFLFPAGGTPAPVPACFDACDGNDDGQINIADAVFALSVLFPQAGQSPMFMPPTGACGQDPTSDMLDCANYDEMVGCP